MPGIFLSYARKDAVAAGRLYEDLKRARGAHVWFDRESLLPGMQWRALLIGLLGQLIVYFADIGFHDATRGCVMDYREKRDDIVESLRHRKLCGPWRKRLKTPGLAESIERLLAWSA